MDSRTSSKSIIAKWLSTYKIHLSNKYPRHSKNFLNPTILTFLNFWFWNKPENEKLNSRFTFILNWPTLWFFRWIVMLDYISTFWWFSFKIAKELRFLMKNPIVVAFQQVILEHTLEIVKSQIPLKNTFVMSKKGTMVDVVKQILINSPISVLIIACARQQSMIKIQNLLPI